MSKQLNKRLYNQQPYGYEPGVFTGNSVEFNPVDFTPFAKSLAMIEARMTAAAEKQSAVDEALGKLELQLNPAEREWFANYKQDIKNQIQGEIDAGNFGSAIRTATKLAGNMSSDSRILGRVEANAKYQTELNKQKERVAKGEVDEDTYKWWLKKNPYSYKDSYDAYGNPISGTEQQFTTLYDKINYAGIAMSAYKMITPYKNRTSIDNASTVNNNTTKELTVDKKTYSPGEAVSTSTRRDNAVERVTVDDIRANIKELIALTPGGFEQVEQDYEAKLYAYKELEAKFNKAYEEDPNSQTTRLLGQQLKKRQELLFTNGARTSYEDYFAKTITNSLFAENLAYDWKTTIRSTDTGYGKTTPTNTGNPKNPTPGDNTDNGFTPVPMWSGAVVEKETNTEQVTIDVSKAGKRAGDRFTTPTDNPKQ